MRAIDPMNKGKIQAKNDDWGESEGTMAVNEALMLRRRAVQNFTLTERCDEYDSKRKIRENADQNQLHVETWTETHLTRCARTTSIVA